MPKAKCYFSEYDKCPVVPKSHFEDCFKQNYIENMTFKQWMQVDNRTPLETMMKLTQEYLDVCLNAVSYTHLDVYKRQPYYLYGGNRINL